MRITDYRLRKLDVPADRPIGDSQIDPIEDFEIAYLELETDAGPTGIGFGHVNFGGSGAVAVDALRRDFAPVGDALVGSAPGAALHRIERPRGNDNSGPGRFDTIVDVALWDLVGKHHDLPVYRLMGGTAADRRVPAYASGLAYARDDDEVRDLYREFAGMGFDAAKVKVGTRPSRPTSTASRWFGTRSTRRRSWPTRTRRSRRRRPSGGGAPTGTPGSTSTGSRIRSSGTTSPACVGWSAR
jgi:L-alanine-DL-glutamate epimerase-like enolase superfamily enzyme